MAIITSFVSKLEAKDWLTISISIAALAVSLFSFIQKQGEAFASTRKLLSEYLKNLLDLNSQLVLVNFDKSREKYPEDYHRTINDQRRFYARQAYLLSRTVKIITPYDYLIMADAYHAVDDPLTAEILYELSVKASHDQINKCITLRNYARFLFSENRTGEARSKMLQAVDEVTGLTGDRYLVYMGDTFLRWANLEFEWKNYEAYVQKLKLAYATFNQIQHPWRKRAETERVKRLLDAISKANPPIDKG